MPSWAYRRAPRQTAVLEYKNLCRGGQRVLSSQSLFALQSNTQTHRSRSLSSSSTNSTTMFAPFVAVATLFALPALAAPTGSSGSCNTGDIQCCNSVEHVSLTFNSSFRFGLCLQLPVLTFDVQSSSAAASGILGLLGINLQDVTGLIGLQCSPLNVLALGGSSACSQQPVCCQNNNVVSIILGVQTLLGDLQLFRRGV